MIVYSTSHNYQTTPELPEVQTTVNGLAKTVVGLTICDVWSDYNSAYWKGSKSIRDPQYFGHFKKEIMGKKVVRIDRRAKNILIYLNDGCVILVHMKMTGHLLYGVYKKTTHWQPIKPEALKDPFNRHIHFVITFSNGKYLTLSDMRKFAKVTLIPKDEIDSTLHLKDLGPEPLEPHFTYEKFKERLALRPRGKIKQVLLEQKIISGIGNIYSDEALWRAGIHPLQKVMDISEKSLLCLYKATREVLKKGIDFGGDSMSDYRNIHGEKGKFQEKHSAYRRVGLKCPKKGCSGTINRIKVGGRSAHFCNIHQKLRK